MLRKAILLAALAAGTLTAPAQAAQYLFSFQTVTPLFGGSVTGSGTFTTSDTAMTVGGQTAYTITSITGMVNGLQIVAPTLASGYGNYFTTGPSFLDGSGVNFQTTTPGSRIAFFNQSSNGLYRVNTFTPGSSSYVSVTTSLVAPVPEPMSWALFITGFALVGGVLRAQIRATGKRKTALA
jgi:hypothetical protein